MRPDPDTEKARLLWDEYKYRHDLIWKNIYKITAASVALSVVPWVDKVSGFFTEVLPKGLLPGLYLVPPALAMVLVLGASVVMVNELQLFEEIKEKYRECQRYKLDFKFVYERGLKQSILSLLLSQRNEQSEQSSQSNEQGKGRILDFQFFVRLYLLVLFVLVASNFVFALGLVVVPTMPAKAAGILTAVCTVIDP